MIILYLVLAVLVLSFIPVTVLTLRAWLKNRGTRVVRCPEARQSSAIRLDAGHAALTSATGDTELRVEKCALWPGHGSCGQECVAQIETG